MSDLIDRSQEIGSKFLAWTPETGPCPISINDHYWFKKLCALFEKQAALEAQLAALTEQTRWIPVGERLPDRRGGCIVAIKSEIMPGSYVRFSAEFFNGDNIFLSGRRNITDKVVFWMPLPNPPEVTND